MLGSTLSRKNRLDNEATNQTLPLRDWQRRLHDRYIHEVTERRDTSPLPGVERLTIELAELLQQMQKTAGAALTASETSLILDNVVNDILGLGILEETAADPLVTDILINRFDTIWVERNGQLQRSGIQFESESHLRKWLERVLLHSGRMLSRSNPIVDAVLPNGARINVVGSPISPDNTIISIRFFRANSFSLRQLIRRNFFNIEVCRFLKFAVRARMNIMIAGASGAGKTTLLNVLASFIPAGERIITLEDTPELSLRHEHVIRMISSDQEQQDTSSLFKAALRMRADRILVGELRGKEVVDALQAMSTGHRGSLSTLHANSAHEIEERVKLLSQLYSGQFSDDAIKGLFSRAVDLLIYMERDKAGRRYVAEVVWRGEHQDRSEFIVYQEGNRQSHDLGALTTYLKQQFADAAEGEENG